MDCDKYKNDTPIKQKPVKPRLKNVHTSQEAYEYSSDLRVYESLMIEWKEHRVISAKRAAELGTQFRHDLFRELGIEGNPKANLLYDKAYQYGHSSGMGEVFLYASSLVKLIL